MIKKIIYEKFIHKKYPYQTIPIVIKTREELDTVCSELLRQFNISVSQGVREVIISDLTNNIYDYIRLSKGDNYYKYYYGLVDEIDINIDRDSYEKIFDVNDLTTGKIKKIIEFGDYSPILTGNPKSREDRMSDWERSKGWGTISEKCDVNSIRNSGYDVINIRIENREELDDFIKILRDLNFKTDYMTTLRCVYTIFNKNAHSFDFDMDEVYISGSGEHMINGQFASDYKLFKNISHIMSLDEFKKIGQKPTYTTTDIETKKQKRLKWGESDINENKDWFPYRFKTENEFIEEFGHNWKRRIESG